MPRRGGDVRGIVPLAGELLVKALAPLQPAVLVLAARARRVLRRLVTLRVAQLVLLGVAVVARVLEPAAGQMR